VVKPSFQPWNGYSSELSTMAGRTMERTMLLSRATSCSAMLLV